MTDSDHGVVSQAINAVGKLPPGFVALLLINTLFLGTVFWFLNSQQIARNEFVTKLFDACVAQSKTLN